MSAAFTLIYEGECISCRLAVKLTAAGDLAGRELLAKSRQYAVECPCCGGVVWFAGEPAPPEEPLPPDPRDLPILAANFSVRSYHSLLRAFRDREDHKGITLGDVADFTEQDILKIRNAGKKVLADIKLRLAEHGLSLRTES